MEGEEGGREVEEMGEGDLDMWHLLVLLLHVLSQ